MPSPSLVLLLLATAASAADQLLFAQSVWRHGDRTPTGTYPSDPYQEEYWGVPWGELTTRGMKQQFLQGQRLKKEYADKYGLVSAKYDREQVTIRSANTPRCLQSGLANTAGFYAGSPTFPSDVPSWPSNWTPVPIHSMPADEDRELEPGTNCDRATELMAERLTRKSFLDFLASHWNLFAQIMEHGGDTIELEFKTLAHIYQAISIEKGYYNLTLPAWITNDLYNELEGAVEDALDYVNGWAGFGHGEDTEILKLRGGFLLREWINNMEAAKGGKEEKYKAYSAHDSTVGALLYALGAKVDAIGKKNPEYASTVVAELWKRDDGNYHVKIMYSDDALHELRPITKFVKGCPTDSDFCLLDTFVARSQKYLATVADCNIFG